jgi:hypothetical protein
MSGEYREKRGIENIIINLSRTIKSERKCVILSMGSFDPSPKVCPRIRFTGRAMGEEE